MKNKRFSIILIFFLASLAMQGQTHVSSPYTRYGIGDLLNSKYLRNTSMGGISFGFRNPNTVNYSNPASYTAFDTLSFVFESGIKSSLTELKSVSQKHMSNYTSLSYLVFGFPVTKWWGSSIGLLPYSSVGYKILDEQNIENIGTTDYLYEGSGGINQFYFGNAFRINDFSVGCNASVLFGSLDKTATVSFPDSSYFFRTKLINSSRVNDFLFGFGMQYQKKLSDKIKIVAGLVYNANTKLSAVQDSLSYRFWPTTSNSETIKDTLINSTGNKGNISLPQSLGGGITMEIGEKWLLGLDYQVQNWTKFESFGINDSLSNSSQAAFGLEYTPNNSALTQRWKRAHYRCGFRYDKTYLQLRNTQLNEMAVSIGLGIPLKKSKTTLNFSFEVGQRGTTEKELIQERFARVIFNLSVHEFWFFKRRFD